MYTVPTQCASGSLFGMAFGDALGADTEFLSVEQILRRFAPYGPQEPQGNPARVTDDTQMALAVGEALLEVAQFGLKATWLSALSKQSARRCSKLLSLGSHLLLLLWRGRCEKRLLPGTIALRILVRQG